MRDRKLHILLLLTSCAPALEVDSTEHEIPREDALAAIAADPDWHIIADGLIERGCTWELARESAPILHTGTGDRSRVVLTAFAECPTGTTPVTAVAIQTGVDGVLEVGVVARIPPAIEGEHDTLLAVNTSGVLVEIVEDEAVRAAMWAELDRREPEEDASASSESLVGASREPLGDAVSACLVVLGAVNNLPTGMTQPSCCDCGSHYHHCADYLATVTASFLLHCAENVICAAGTAIPECEGWTPDLYPVEERYQCTALFAAGLQSGEDGAAFLRRLEEAERIQGEVANANTAVVAGSFVVTLIGIKMNPLLGAATSSIYTILTETFAPTVPEAAMISLVQANTGAFLRSLVNTSWGMAQAQAYCAARRSGFYACEAPRCTPSSTSTCTKNVLGCDYSGAPSGAILHLPQTGIPVFAPGREQEYRDYCAGRGGYRSIRGYWDSDPSRSLVDIPCCAQDWSATAPNSPGAGMPHESYPRPSYLAQPFLCAWHVPATTPGVGAEGSLMMFTDPSGQPVPRTYVTVGETASGRSCTWAPILDPRHTTQPFDTIGVRPYHVGGFAFTSLNECY